MTDFDVIEFGYNRADETVNFGTRSLADGDNLYEASTVATLKPSKQNEKNVNPHINAVIQKGSIYFSVDSSLKIFKDKECSDMIFNAEFKAVIDSFCVSNDYFLICLRNGEVNLIDCNNDFDCIFSETCVRNDDGDSFFINSFLCHDCFLLVTKIGQVFKLQISPQPKIELVYEFNFKTEIAAFEYPFLLVDGSRLAVLDLENNNITTYGSFNFRKVFSLRYMFLALDFDGNLYRICAITLLIFPINNSILYKDMQVLSDPNQKQLIVVTEDEPGQNFIQLLSYPDLTKIYSLKVSNQIHLIQLEFLNDEMLYISKIINDGSVTEIRFHMVYETEPEQRLHRLLKQHKYEEAEKFATLFNLDKSLISKARAWEIVEKTICSSEDIHYLINLLQVIEDDEFRLRCCTNVEESCSCFEDVRKVLNYGCQLQLKKQDRKAEEEVQKTVIHRMHRFDTFMTLNRGVEQGMSAWSRFLRCDLIEEVPMMLRNYQIEEAKIIYSRLDEQTSETLSENHISEILNVLNNIPIATYEPFLQIFIPITLSILPSTLPLFVKWTYSKVFNLEKRVRSDFPNNAIKFTEKIVGLMRVGDVGDISFQRQCVLHRDCLLELSTLLSTLKTLKVLKDEYRISIPVKGYLSGPQSVIRLLLNIELSPDDYDAFLKHFLCKYMVENHMEPNEILLDEIKDLMQYEEIYWRKIIGSILNCISSVRVKLEAVRVILDRATVPWSDTVRAIANDSLKYSDSLTSEIRNLIKDEPIQIVLREPKYKIKERRIHNINDLKFILNRIIYCNEPTMVEDVYQLCTNAEHRHVANMLLIRCFIRAGCLDKAMDLLDNNTPEEVLSCARELAVMVEVVVNNGMGLSSELTNNYNDVAKSILKRLNSHAATDDFERSTNGKTVDLINSVYNLYKHFRIKTTTYDLSKDKNKYVDVVLEEARRDFETGKQTIDGVFAVCHKLSTSLTMDNNEILMRFCEKNGDYNVILKSARKMYDSETSSRNLSLMVVLLMKYVGTYKLQLLDNSLSDSEGSLILSTDAECVVDDDVFCKGLQLAEIMIAKAVYKSEMEDVGGCLEVARWVNTAFYFTRDRDWELKKRLFGDVYESASLLPGFLTFSTIKNVFNAFCGYVGIAKNPLGIYFNTDYLSEEDFMKELKMLPSTLDNLSKEGQHFTCFKLMECLKQSLVQFSDTNQTIINFLNNILKNKCIPKVLSSILSNKIVDVELLYSLLLSCDFDDAHTFLMNSLRMYKRHPEKFGCLVRLGLRFWKRHGSNRGVVKMNNSLLTLKWWKKFETKKLDYDSFFKITAEERFEVLINADYLDMNLVKEFSEDYNLDLIISYKFLLNRIFQNWKPDYEIKTEESKKILIVKNSEKDLLDKCRDVMEVLDNEQIFNLITNLWNCINPYYYEVFLAMLDILSSVKPEDDNHVKKAMLDFLKNYQRVSKPSETEIETWYTNFPDTQSLDVLSEFRLSFTQFLFTKQIFNVIRPEVNLKTYKLWFGAIEILKPFLNKNELCSFVVKDVVASGVLTKDATDSWVLHPKHEDLLRDVDECVMNITNLELTTSGVYYLLTHIPNGADQVNAAKLCYKYALKYRSENPGSIVVEKAVTKVEKKYFTYSALHILHTHQLVEKKYMNLVTQPNELIQALYSDEKIWKKGEVDLNCPDINKATEALAELFNLDINKIRFEIVANWLSDNPTTELCFDSSMMFSIGNCSDEDNLNRIAYVCCAQVKDWQTKLFQIGLGTETGEEKSVHCKAKALKVFAMISDVDVITESTGLTYEEFMNFIDKLTVVSNLQYLGIGLDVEALDHYSKKELLNRLAQRVVNVLAVKTMALICMTYKIYDVKYWEFIVNTAIKLSMYVELKSYVTVLNKAKYYYKNFYINAWQKLIDYSFSNLNNLELLDQILLSNFLSLQSCPVLYCLNFDNAFRKCMDRDKVEFAAVLLQYLDGSRRDEYVKEIRNSNKDLVTSLNNLDQNGLWGISHVKAMLANQ